MSPVHKWLATPIAVLLASGTVALQRRSHHSLLFEEDPLLSAEVDTFGTARRSSGASERLCAIGDLHGDLQHALRALRLCDAINDDGQWSGGRMTVVQTGDVVDRGNASLPLLRYLWQLRDEAASAGGELVLLLGNHELLNLQGRVHYVHGFSRVGAHTGELVAAGGLSAWRQLMDPSAGEVGQRLVTHDALAVRGAGACRTLFLHAGLRSAIAAKYGSVAEINAALRIQLAGSGGDLTDSKGGVLWWRGAARPAVSEATACAEVDEARRLVGDGATRVAVGHNIVPWITHRCDGRLQLLDVGMSSYYGGKPAAWRCELNAHGAADVRALYEGRDETPPHICERCERLQPDEGSDYDWEDCYDYCGTVRKL